MPDPLEIIVLAGRARAGTATPAENARFAALAPAALVERIKPKERAHVALQLLLHLGDLVAPHAPSARARANAVGDVLRAYRRRDWGADDAAGCCPPDAGATRFLCFEVMRLHAARLSDSKLQKAFAQHAQD